MEDGFVLKNRVRELRVRLHLRQSDLAREVDATRQTILAIEKGRLNPSVLLSLKIARVLREPAGYVFYLDRAEASGNCAECGVNPSEAHSVESDAARPRAVFDFS
jgi:putative transcriptional regulator